MSEVLTKYGTTHSKVGFHGIRVNGLLYWCKAFQKMQGQTVEVRYVKDNLKSVSVRVGSLWYTAKRR